MIRLELRCEGAKQKEKAMYPSIPNPDANSRQSDRRRAGHAFFPCCRCATSSSFPHMIVPLFVGREKSIRALEEVMKNDALIIARRRRRTRLTMIRTPDAIYETGTRRFSVLQLLEACRTAP